MSCYGCATKYSIFNKENGCPNCGFSYCNKCLKFKALIPKLGSSEHLVCKSCHSALTDLGAKSTQQDHPAAFLQRLESLENPGRPPITVYQHDQRMEQLKTGLTQTDREIADRLEKLREDRKRERLPSEDEIAQRLALLKGEDPLRMSSAQCKNIKANVRSHQQQADDLLQQFQEEQQLALKHPSPEEDIATRLAQLRGRISPVVNKAIEPNASAAPKDNDDESNNLESMSLSEANALLTQLREEEKLNVGEFKELGTSAKRCLKEMRTNLMKKSHNKGKELLEDLSSESDNDDETTQQVIQKVLDEAALEENLALSDCSDGSNSDHEELPWCVICDKNAELKCTNCSGDLYCSSCFKQGHRDLDMKDHKAVPFKATKK